MSTCRAQATMQVSLDHYRRESMKVLRMFQEGLPSGEIGTHSGYQVRAHCADSDATAEKASIDEAFIDFTQPVRDEILRRYPYLSQVPSDAPDGVDSPLPTPPPIMWDGLGTVIAIGGSSTDTSMTGSTQTDDQGTSRHNDDGANSGDDSTTWHDVALAIAAGRAHGQDPS